MPGSNTEGEENVIRALKDHLRWPDAKAARIVDRSLASGLIVRERDRLGLTPRGRVEARAILEPWRQDA